MDGKLFFVCGISFFVLQFCTVWSAKSKDPRDCEVCISVLDRFVKSMEDLEDSKKTDIKVVEKRLEKFCEGLKSKDREFCTNLGAVKGSPTRILLMAAKPLAYHKPVEKICKEDLKKADGEICTLRYPKQIDLANTNLKKLRVNELKKILSNWGEDDACKGCMEKTDFIREVERLMPKYDAQAFAKYQENKKKTEL